MKHIKVLVTKNCYLDNLPYPECDNASYENKDTNVYILFVSKTGTVIAYFRTILYTISSVIQHCGRGIILVQIFVIFFCHVSTHTNSPPYMNHSTMKRLNQVSAQIS